MRHIIKQLMIVLGVFSVSGCNDSTQSTLIYYERNHSIKEELSNRLETFEHFIRGANSGKVTNFNYIQLGDIIEYETNWFEFNEIVGRWTYGLSKETISQSTRVVRQEDKTLVQSDFNSDGPFYRQSIQDNPPISSYFTGDVIINDIENYPVTADYFEIDESTFQVIFPLLDVEDTIAGPIINVLQLLGKSEIELEAIKLTHTFQFDEINSTLISRVDWSDLNSHFGQNEITYEHINSYVPESLDTYLYEQSMTEKMDVKDLIVGDTNYIANPSLGQFFRIYLHSESEYQMHFSKDYESIELYNSTYKLVPFDYFLIDSSYETKFSIKETGFYYIYIYVSNTSYNIELFLQ